MHQDGVLEQKAPLQTAPIPKNRCFRPHKVKSGYSISYVIRRPACVGGNYVVMDVTA